MSSQDHDGFSDRINYLNKMRSQAIPFEKSSYPKHVLEDTIFSSEPNQVLIRAETTEGEILHVVLISSFDGIHWFCWIIEHQRFDIMETESG
jgi:hypothetical protein